MPKSKLCGRPKSMAKGACVATRCLDLNFFPSIHQCSSLGRSKPGPSGLRPDQPSLFPPARALVVSPPTNLSRICYIHPSRGESALGLSRRTLPVHPSRGIQGSSLSCTKPGPSRTPPRSTIPVPHDEGRVCDGPTRTLAVSPANRLQVIYIHIYICMHVAMFRVGHGCFSNDP